MQIEFERKKEFLLVLIEIDNDNNVNALLVHSLISFPISCAVELICDGTFVEGTNHTKKRKEQAK